MIEFSLDTNLAEMISSIKGQRDRFLRVQIKFPKKKDADTFEFRGDSEGLVDKVTELVRRGKVKIITQATGTYTEGSSPKDQYRKNTK